MSYAEIAAVARAEGAPPPFLGDRFDAGGDALRCSGNTIIGHVREGAPAAALRAASDALAATDAGAHFAWLPHASLHMTLFNGLLHAERDAARWPPDLAADADEPEADAFMAEALCAVLPEGPPVFQMAPQRIVPAGRAGLTIEMEAVDIAEDARLRRWRDALAESCGLTARPGHAEYAFHITLAYSISWAEPDAAAALDAALAEESEQLRAAAPVIPIGPPEYCVFADMTHFEPIAVMR